MRDHVRAPRPRARRGARLRLCVLGASGALCALLPRLAAAQSRTFYLDRIFMAGAPDDGIGVWRPHMGETTRFYGQFALGLASQPFRVENEIADVGANRDTIGRELGPPVEVQLIGYAHAGVEIRERVGIQVSFPAALYQGGNGTSFAGIANSTVDLQPAAPMDLRLDARVIVLRTQTRSFKLGAQAAVWIPTGNARSYGGDGSASGLFGLAAEVDVKKAFFVLDAGVHVRPDGGVNDFAVSNELRFAAGAFVPLAQHALRLGAQIFGGAGTSGGATYPAANVPLEWMAEARYNPDAARRGWLSLGGGTRLTPGYAPNLRVVALAGYAFGIEDTRPPAPLRGVRGRYADHGGDRDRDGIPDDIDLCPDDPEDGKPPNPDDGCPALPDRDGDGIPDISDRCPDNPEDFDGIQDADGCPEDDADKDGIPDAQDACATAPGLPSVDPKKNGCPRFIAPPDGTNKIFVLKQIEFETGKAKILKSSYPILDEVVKYLEVNTHIGQLAVEGHTDNRGPDDLNERLSNDRAHAVKTYLIEHGIDARRLSAQGYGPKRPIADNGTAAGRQRNRRVDFTIR
jgi:OmpA-OmpF porin, OOP family